MVDSKTLTVLKPICWMSLFGLVYGFNNEFTDIVRDIWHILKALSCVMVGYFLFDRIYQIPRLLKHFVIVSLVLSLLYLAPFIMGVREIGLHHSFEEVKIPLVTAISLPLLINKQNGVVNLSAYHLRVVALFSIVLAYGFSFSRTAMGCAIIFVLAGLGFFDNVKRLLILMIAMGLLVFFTSPLLPSIETGDITFASKISNSIAEIAFTDDSDSVAMIVNWRGFEAYRAFVEFINSTPLQQLAGRGFGATVDLGISVQMSEEMNYQFIPVLHNGYMHTLAKYGVAGVAFYLTFLARIGRKGIVIPSNYGHVTLNRILIGLSLVLAYTTLVISGIFNTENLDPILIMLGVFLGIAERQRKLYKLSQSS